MGCAETKQIHPNKKKPYSKEGASLPQWLCSEVVDALKKNDLFLVRRTFNEKQIFPGCHLGPSEEGWNCYHECCRRTCPDVLAFLVDLGHTLQPDKVNAAINRKDKDGNTPAMICCKYDVPKNLKFLLRTRLVDLTPINKDGRNAQEVADVHSDACRQLIDSYKAKNSETESPDLMIQKPKDRVANESGSFSSVNERSDSKLQSRAERIKTMLSQANENFQIYNILANMENDDQVFVDEEFPAQLSSLTTNQEDPLYNVLSQAKWLRPGDILHKDFSSLNLYERVASDDLIVGLQTTSTMQIALQVLSEFPSRLIQCIINKEVNKHGIYSCKFYVMGLAAEVYSDDRYPCNEKGEPLFLHAKNQELWPLVIEKSAAKFYGCYRNTQEGLLDDVFEDILGVPCANYKIEGLETQILYDLLHGNLNQNHILAFSSLDPSHFRSGNYKIQDGHYLISVWEENEVKYAKLRAPSGKLKEKKVAEHVPSKSDRDKYFSVLSNENAFVVRVEDLSKYFDLFSVAFYNENWHKNFISINSYAKHAEYVSLTVTSLTKLYIVANQESMKLAEEADYEYSNVELHIIKEDGSRFKPIGNHLDLLVLSSDFFGAPSILFTKLVSSLW